jgi:hypothetical protein
LPEWHVRRRAVARARPADRRCVAAEPAET